MNPYTSAAKNLLYFSLFVILLSYQSIFHMEILYSICSAFSTQSKLNLL